MSQIKTLNGVQYTLPQLNDTNWGANTGNVLTQYIAAIADCTLQLTGGAFTLTADADFGANFGLKTLYLKSETANISTSGVLRLASTDTIGWRNNANGANVSLSKDTSDNLLWGGTKVIISGAIVNADIAAGAAIAVNKLAALTVSRAVASDASGFITPSTTTAAELAFVSGVTSAIQTQLNAISAVANAALPLAGGTLTGSGNVSGIGVLTFQGTSSATGSVRFPNTGTLKWRNAGNSADIGFNLNAQNNFAFDSNILFNTTTNGIVGTTTNDNAAAGNVGQYISSAVTAVSAVASTNWGDLTSISLPAGDWDVSAIVFWDGTSATWSRAQMGVSTTSGNTTTGLSFGDNRAVFTFANTSTVITQQSLAVPCYRMSLAGTTTVYLKYAADYTAGTPAAYGRISARRVR